jgi:hypothetical protein
MRKINLGGFLATILAVVRMKIKAVTARVKNSGPCPVAVTV